MRYIIRAAAAILLGTVLGLIICELALVLLLPSPLRYYYPQPLHLPDQQLGWVMVPNQHSYTIDKPVATNSQGFRSPAVTVQRNPSSLRVICLGDSQTFGNGVAQDATYPARLQSHLSIQAPQGPVEVINAGVQGYNIQQEVDLLERIAPVLRPDFATIGFYINDIDEVLRSIALTLKEGEFQRAGFRGFVPYRLIYALKRSRLVTLVYWRYRALKWNAKGNPLKEVLLGNTPRRYERSWELIEEALRRAQWVAAAHRFRLIVLPIPYGDEFLADYANEEYRSRFLALARKLGIDSIDPTPRMKEAGGAFDRYFITWDGHINRVTHDLIAQLLATEVSGLRRCKA